MSEEQLVLDVVINNEQSGQSLTEMKKEYRELQGLLSNLDINSDSFKLAAQRAAELKDNMDDASEAVRSMQGEGSLEGVNTSLGRMGERIKNLDFDGLSKDITLMGTSLSNIKLSTVTGGLKSVAGAIGKVTGAILSSPLFWFAAAIAAVGYALYELTNLFGNHTTALEDMEENQKAVFEETKKLEGQFITLGDKVKETTGDVEAHAEALENYNEKAEAENLLLIDVNANMSEQNAIMKINNDLLEGRGKIQAGNNELDKINAEFLDAQLNASAMAKITGKDENEILAEMTQNYKDRTAEVKNYIDAASNEISAEEDLIATRKHNAETLAWINKINAEGAKNQADELKKLADAWKKADEKADAYYKTLLYNAMSKEEQAKIDYQNELKYIEDSLKAGYLTKIEYENAKTILDENYLEKRKEFAGEIVKIDTGAEEKIVNTRKKLQIDGYAADVLSWNETNETKLSLLKDALDQQLITQQEYQDAVNTIEDEALALKEKRIQEGINFTKNALEFASNLAKEGSKKQYKIQKAGFNIDKVVSSLKVFMDTKGAIAKNTAELGAIPAIPINIWTGLQGAMSIAAILSKKFPAYSDGGGGDTGGGSVGDMSSSSATPNLGNLYGSGGSNPTNFNSLSPDNQGTTNQRVYVLESDITDTQKKVKNVSVQSSF